jgi:hypothetical protein
LEETQNSEVYKLYDGYVLKFIKLSRLRWAGHVMRMEERDPARESFVLNKEELEIGKEADQS